MNNFLVTLFPDNSPELLGQLSDILSTSFNFWACEFEAGLFFISADCSAEEIFEEVAPQLELDLPNSFFVFQLSGSWAGFGSTNTREALSARLIQP